MMNGKIRDIAEQAGYFIDFDKNGGIIFKNTPGNAGDLELFAKLIINECINYCGENLPKTVGGALKIHFGVK